MIRCIRIALLLASLSLVCPLPAGEYNKKLNVGDPAPAWANLPGVDGKMHGLADLKDKDVVVVVFTCTSCPIARDYEDRIIAFTKKYADKKVGVVAINVNVVEEDKLPKMIERSKTKEFNFAYLFDESQKIAKDFGAMYTPEFFVLNQDRKVVYMGAMDDANTATKVKADFLSPAVDAALKGDKIEKGETLGRGCFIRYVRDKK